MTAHDHQASRREWQGPTTTTREPLPLTDPDAIHAQNQRLRERLAGSERARACLIDELDAAHRTIRAQSGELASGAVASRGATMQGWVDDDDDEERAMRAVDRIGALALLIFLAFALFMLCVEIRDITIPLG